MRRGATDGWRTVGDDGAGLGRDLELLRGVLEHRGEGRRLGHAEPAGTRQSRIGEQPPEDGDRSIAGASDPREGGRRRWWYSHFERELGVGGEDDLKGHLPSCATARRRRRRHGGVRLRLRSRPRRRVLDVAVSLPVEWACAASVKPPSRARVPFLCSKRELRFSEASHN